MPWGDRTGPAGLGPLTGRRAGFCAGYRVPGFLNRVFGPFAGFGWGRCGWGWRRARAYASWAYPLPVVNPDWPDPVDEEEMLKASQAALHRHLQAIEKRLAELAARKPNAGGESGEQ